MEDSRIMSEDPREVFAGAQWIWPESQGFDLVNYYMQARRAFTLAAAPRTCRIRVTADSWYKLFVNGKYVCRGPARGFQYSWPYDEAEIGPYLVKGRNAVALVAYSLGIGNHQYVCAEAGGAILAGRAAGVDISTGPEWRVRRAPAYARDAARLTYELGFEESFDARLDDGSWTGARYDDTGWRSPRLTPAGSMPWHSVEPRGIPMMREEVVLPAAIVAESRGRSAKDWREAGNLTALFVGERRAWRRSGTALKRAGRAAAFRAAPTGRGRYRTYLVDFASEVIGSVGFEVKGAAGGEVVDAQAAETLTGLKPDVLDPAAGCKIAIASRLVLRKGATRHEQFQPWGFRYLAVTVRETSKPLTIGVYLRTTVYPLEVKARFRSDDPVLDRIYDISVRTERLCMLDAYVDCPWREQAQWWGDARIQAANTFHLSADARLLARGVRQTAGQAVPNGLTYGVTPTTAHHCVLPDYTLTWIMTIWDYYRQTGDASLAREHAPRMFWALDYFRGVTAKNGLLPYDDRYWLFLDWAAVFKEGYPTLYNIMYFWALETAARLFGLIGAKREAAELAARARASRKAIMGHLFDRRRRAFHGGLDWNGRPAGKDTAHPYALAILSGLCPEYDEAFTRERLLPLVAMADPVGESVDRREPESWVDLKTPSPFFIYYVFEALKARGRKAEVIRCIRRWWGAFVDDAFTTTPENWVYVGGSISACHAWSAHPVVHLLNVVLGVTEDAVAWRSITFEPVFDCCGQASGAVATPLGEVEVSWRTKGGRADVNLAVPRGMTAKVSLPGVRRTVRAGRHRWNVAVAGD